MATLKAVLWDVDGTLAETERDAHRVAFNMAFDVCGLPWRWSETRYGELLRITGGKERLLHYMQSRSDRPVVAAERSELAALLHRKKNAYYAEIVRQGRISLRAGVRELIDECASLGLRLGITTTTSRSNVEALMPTLLGPGWNQLFAVSVCGEDVQSKKPDPEVFLKALEALRIGPLEALAIEDSPGGASAARAAEVPVIVTRSAYFLDSSIEGAIAIGPGFHTRCGWTPTLRSSSLQSDQVRLDDLLGWRAQMNSVSQYS